MKTARFADQNCLESLADREVNALFNTGKRAGAATYSQQSENL